MSFDQITYTTKPSAESSDRYIAVYFLDGTSPDGSFVSRHRNIEECTESALEHAATLPEGDYEYRFVPPEKHMSLRILSPSMGGGALPPVAAAGSNEARIDEHLSAYTIPFSASLAYPADPSTSSTIEVDTIAEFQSAVGNSNVIINVAAGTYNGNLTITGDDIDIVMSNSATLNGSVTASSSNARIRWTGGNVVTGSGTFSVTAPSTDWLFDDFNFDGRWDFGGNGAVSRVAIINSSANGDPFNDNSLDGMFFFSPNSGHRYSDLILANTKFDTRSDGNYVSRIQRIDRVVVVDSAHNMLSSTPGSAVGLRFGRGADDIFVSNTKVGNRIFASLQVTGGELQVTDARFETVERYTRNDVVNTWMTHHPDNPPNTGVVNNCTVFNNTNDFQNGNAFTLDPDLTTEEGNELITDYVNLPDVSSYGAQR